MGSSGYSHEKHHHRGTEEDGGSGESFDVLTLVKAFDSSAPSVILCASAVIVSLVSST